MKCRPPKENQEQLPRKKKKEAGILHRVGGGRPMATWEEIPRSLARLLPRRGKDIGPLKEKEEFDEEKARTRIFSHNRVLRNPNHHQDKKGELPWEKPKEDHLHRRGGRTGKDVLSQREGAL